MKVLNVQENVDGSANLDVELTPDELQFFLEYAIVDILEKTVQNKISEGENNNE